jgi:universal stress protein A
MKVKASSHPGVRTDSNALPISLSAFTVRNILVPTDFTECSLKALSYALSFAKQFGAEILLMHVVESVPVMTQDAMLESSMLSVAQHEESEKRLRQWQLEGLTEATINTVTYDGVPWQKVVEIAKEKNVDLIVAGTGGRGGLARALLGSTAERIVRHAPCPVLVVREREHDFVVSAEMDGESKSLLGTRS